MLFKNELNFKRNRKVLHYFIWPFDTLSLFEFTGFKSPSNTLYRACFCKSKSSDPMPVTEDLQILGLASSSLLRNWFYYSISASTRCYHYISPLIISWSKSLFSARFSLGGLWWSNLQGLPIKFKLYYNIIRTARTFLSRYIIIIVYLDCTTVLSMYQQRHW